MKPDKNILLAAGALFSATAVSYGTSPDSPKPNIVVIMCDDMGYGDLGCYGQKYISTPNHCKIAAPGKPAVSGYAPGVNGRSRIPEEGIS